MKTEQVGRKAMPPFFAYLLSINQLQGFTLENRPANSHVFS